MNKKYAEVYVNLPVEGGPFTYLIPDHLTGDVEVGRRVLVPFGRRTVTGYVSALSSSSDLEKVRSITDLLDTKPLFDAVRLKFYLWLSTYYMVSPGTALSLTHPAAINQKSQRHLALTEAGTLELKGKDKESELLRAVGDKGITMSALIKKFKGKAVYGLVERLKEDGLLTEEVRIGKQLKEKTEKVVALKGVENKLEVMEALKRSPAQRRLYEYLRGRGELSLKELRGIRELSGLDGAVRKLEERGFLSINKRTIRRDPSAGVVPRLMEHTPNVEQRKAIDSITKSIGSGYSPFLLFGVTGSGKTLVYIRAIEDALKKGRRAMLLVPEIALTHRMAAYLLEHFKGRVAVLHSALSDGERSDEWRRILEGKVDVVVGARSALFSPIKNLGLIIVDEEHDSSYSQDEGIRYNARDAALMLANMLGITIVLGTATPALETFHNVKLGRIALLKMEERVGGATMPEVELLDMRRNKGVVISERLASLMEITISDGGQVLLFLNRRGYSSFIICRSCGEAVKCVNCDLTLTMHKRAGRLKCHYCDFELSIPDECSECGALDMVDPGIGTEKVEEEVRVLLPKARVARLDRDSTRKKGTLAKVIEAVEVGDVDVLIGTQMVTKGHHFPSMRLVGVISGDTSLNMPDFRSSERTFQLIAQASGRAGRSGSAEAAKSRVVVQTFNPEHFCLTRAAKYDYEGFFDEEMAIRKEVGYPPVIRLASIRIESINDNLAFRAAEALRKVVPTDTKGLSVLGPAPALVARLRGKYRYQILVKATDVKVLHRTLFTLRHFFNGGNFTKVSMRIDVDPASTL